MRSTTTTSTRCVSGGDTPVSTTCWRSARSPRSSGWCCPITPPCTPTPTSTPSASAPAARGTATVSSTWPTRAWRSTSPWKPPGRPRGWPTGSARVIREALAGKRIGVTGATGFLGTALVERLLRSVPDCDVVVLVRPGRRTNAEVRVRREILRNDAFNRLRAELGDRFDEEMARRLTVLPGDVGVDGLGLDETATALFQSCDAVIHSAASVSFDSPL